MAETASTLPLHARINPLLSYLATYIPHIDGLFVEGTKERGTIRMFLKMEPPQTETKSGKIFGGLTKSSTST
jgi:hypothetical protein